MNIVRKIILPVAAGLLASSAVMAGDIATETGTRNLSDEYLRTADTDDTVDSARVVVILGASYAINDRINLDFTGSALDPTSLPLNIVQAPVGVDCTATITLGRTSESPSQAVYRVTDTTGPGTATCEIDFTPLGPLVFDAQGVQAANGVTVTFSAELNTGGPLDTGGGDLRSDAIFTVNTQWEAVATTPFDQVVDVEADRERFANFPPDEDILQIFIQETDDGPFDLAATAVDSEHTVAGDWSWVRDIDPDTAGIQQPDNLGPGAVIQVTGSCDQTTLAVTATEITYGCTAGATGVRVDVSNNDDPVDGPAVLPSTSWVGTIVVNYNGFAPVAAGEAATTLMSSTSVGRWVLNGFQAFIPYMPYGANIGQVIYLANRGVQSGDVTVDWVGLNGTSGSLGVIATLGAGSTLSIGPLINAALPAAERANGRLALTVTANVPARDAQLNSQYNASGNRAFALHDDNRPDLASGGER